MKENLSQNNQSFGYLHNSTDFLSLIIDDVTSCILLLDRNMNLYAFNEPLRTLFSPDEKSSLLYKKCGNVIGCEYAVDENKECGQTTHCTSCVLRESAIESYMNNIPIYKNKLSRYFYTSNNNKVLKHLRFSTKLFYFKMDKYIVLILDDVTELIEQQAIIEEQRGIIIEMSKN